MTVDAAAPERVLVAGVGNIFLSDDGFGSAVANELLTRPLPPVVRVVDYGIRGVHLAFDLTSDVSTLILVDTVPDAGGPGGVVVMEVDPANYGAATFDAHSMDPNTVLQSVAALGDEMPRTLVVGCQPDSLDDGIGLTPSVAAAVPVAADTTSERARRERGSLKGPS
ncbi:hydrogenase maturation protease [soil metagenome]